MKKRIRKTAVLLALFCLLALSAAAAEAETAAKAAGWQITLLETGRSASLNTVSVSMGYSSVETAELSETADDGYEFLLLKLSLTKEDSTEVIDWKRLTVTDSAGNAYTRTDDDFITDYGMSRLPGTVLNFGSYEGWICFLVPKEAEGLTLVYPFEEETLTIPIPASEDPAETETESETEGAAETALRWSRVPSEDLFTAQRAIDADLYEEAQKGYAFTEPLVVVNPYGNSPLTAMVIFTTAEETGVDCVVYGKSPENDITFAFEAETTHILPVYGLYAGESTEVELTLDDGQCVTLSIETEALDSAISEAAVTADTGSDAMEDGVLTFVSINSFSLGYAAAAYDNAGDLRWAVDSSVGIAMPLKRLANGRLMMTTSEVIHGTYYATGLVEFDPGGKLYSVYLVPGGVHHDFLELADGNLLVCSCAEDFSTVEDRIVEIDRQTGEVVYELNLSDLITPGDGGSVNRTETDWAHNNSIDYDEATDTILLSCRHLDAVLAVNKTAKTLSWILGDPTGFTGVSEDLFFTPAGEDEAFSWQYAQHNASFLTSCDILLFDNGTSRCKEGHEEEAVTGDAVYSRACVYHIDTKSMTVTLSWTYGEERGAAWYSSFISGALSLGADAYWLTSGGNAYDAENDTYDLGPVAAYLSGEQHTYMDLVEGGALTYELTVPYLSFRSLRLPLYAEENVYSVTQRGTWYGSLGAVAQAESDAALLIDPAAAAEVDFTLSTVTETPDRLTVSGTWPATGTDASLVLIDEEGSSYRFAIAQPSYRTSADSMDFAVWITSASVPLSHRYKLYLYNEGTLYATRFFWDNYADTSASKGGRGAQDALYDADDRVYTQLSSADAVTVTSDTLETERTMPEQTAAVSDAILAAAQNYTFADPLVIQDPYQCAPLTAVAAFRLETARRVRVTVKGKTQACDITDVIDADTLQIVPILGLYAGTDNTVVLELLDDAGGVTDTVTLTVSTEALPASLQKEVVRETAAAESSMDLMLVSGLAAPCLCAFDAAGDIRWYCTLEWEYYGAFPLTNGHFLMEAPDVLYPNASMPNSPEFWEMDYLGRVYRVCYFPEGVHHEIREMTPGGNFLIATNSNDGYEQNLIQEIDRETGAVVKSLSMNDLFAGLSYIDRDDWTHVNTLSYDEETDTVLISSRNLHSVIRVNWTTFEIEWILADPEFWAGTDYEKYVLSPTSDFEWHYQQHAAYALSEDLDGNPDTVEILLFDNHNAQYRMLTDFSYTGNSYVKIYSVDPEGMTVTQLRSYPTAFSSITSDAFLLGDENRVFSVNAYLSSSEARRGKVYEIDYDTGQILNTWSIRRCFYRGYAVSLSMNACAGAFELPENSVLGTLRTVTEIPEADAVRLAGTVTLDAESARFSVTGDVLYLYAGNNLYTQVIFNGTGKNTWVYDVSDIKLLSGSVNSYRFKLPIPLKDLPADTYTVQIMYGNRLCETGVSFTVS